MSCGYILPIRITGQAEDAISNARRIANGLIQKPSRASFILNKEGSPKLGSTTTQKRRHASQTKQTERGRLGNLLQQLHAIYVAFSETAADATI